MKGLKCTTANCEFNECFHCIAGVINISENAVCKSKIKRTNGVIEQEFVNMEAAEEFDYDNNQDVLIECESTACVYNNSHRCYADLVNIGDGLLRTKCMTKTLSRD